ncbi:MAG: PQQ-binding-like beta-propeller repeat protein [Candidatus Acidiferrales bacterium]
MRAGFLAAIILAVGFCCSASSAQTPDGAAIFHQKCAMCHDSPSGRIPSHEMLSSLPPDTIIFDLTFGVMQPEGLGLSADEIAAVATFLTGKSSAPGVQPKPDANLCPASASPIQIEGSLWNGWGHDVENSRFQPDPGIPAADISKLSIKWTFAYPGPVVGTQPTVVGDHLFVGTSNGWIYALNAKTGCTDWTFHAGSDIRGSLSAGPFGNSSEKRFAVYFADMMQASAFAVDASTGKLLWKTKVDDHPLARITGSPVFFGNRLYVPVSSQEEGYGAVATYACCTFRGSVVALDASTGKILWKTYPIEEAPKPFKKTSAGVQMYGPAGAAIWSAPTVDTRRKLIYVGTGDSFTDVPTSATDSIVAMDMDTGKIKWVMQATAHDDYLFGCNTPGKGICPDPVGPDYDFGASPILRTLPDGKQIILAAQKSGMVYGLDPDDQGKLLWKIQVGPGSMGGGTQYGFAATDNTAYVPNGNRSDSSLSALEIAGGKMIWHKPAPAGQCSWGQKGCSGVESAAVTAIPGVVFSGSQDGHLRAYSAADGSVLWNFDTGQQYDAVNGVVAHGGSLGNEGPVAAAGMLYVVSGEGRFTGRRGNALIALSVGGK